MTVSSSESQIKQLKESDSELVILADVGGITVTQGDDYSIDSDNLIEDWVSFENANGVLTIRYQPPTPETLKGIDTSSHNFIITLPSNYQLLKANFNAGTGAINISDFALNKLMLSQGYGDINTNRIEVNSLVIECGTGIVNTQNTISKQTTELHAGTGDIELSGDLSGT